MTWLAGFGLLVLVASATGFVRAALTYNLGIDVAANVFATLFATLVWLWAWHLISGQRA